MEVIVSGAGPAVTQARREVALSAPTRTGHTVSALISSWLGENTESVHTREAYGRDLSEYTEWCATKDLDPLAVKLPDVTMYAAALADAISPVTGRPFAKTTRARKLAAVSSWYRFLVRAGAIDSNPAVDVKRPRYDRRHSPTSSVNESQATAMKDAGAGSEHRTLGRPCVVLVLALMIDLGIRVSEVCGANMADLGQRDGMRTLTVRMKGGKVRTRPIPTQLGIVLDRYVAAQPVVAPDDDDATHALLRALDGRRINRHQVYRMVQRMAALAGVPAPRSITPHSMRHAFNSIARELGAPIEARREAMGHSSVGITELYDHVALSLTRDPAHLVAAATAPAQLEE